MNSQQQQPSTASRGNAIEQMQKMALCQAYLNSLTGDQAQQMQAFALYSQAQDIGEDDIRRCMMMQHMQTNMVPSPRNLPESEDMMEFNFWQRMKEQVAANNQQQ